MRSLSVCRSTKPSDAQILLSSYPDQTNSYLGRLIVFLFFFLRGGGMGAGVNQSADGRE